MKKNDAPQAVDPLADVKAMIGHIKPASEFVWFPALLAKTGSREKIETALKTAITSQLSKSGDPSTKNAELLHIGVPNGIAEDVYTFEVTVAYKDEERVITVETPMERIRRVYDEFVAQNAKN